MRNASFFSVRVCLEMPSSKMPQEKVSKAVITRPRHKIAVGNRSTSPLALNSVQIGMNKNIANPIWSNVPIIAILRG